MNDMLHLRRGERFNPDEYPSGALEEMHERLDAIRDEEFVPGPRTGLLIPRPVPRTRRERARRVLSVIATVLAIVALMTLTGFVVSLVLGFGAAVWVGWPW